MIWTDLNEIKLKKHCRILEVDTEKNSKNILNNGGLNNAYGICIVR